MIKNWGIWILNEEEPHLFKPIVGKIMTSSDQNISLKTEYNGKSEYIKDFYKAYYYLVQVEIAKKVINSFLDNKNDLYIFQQEGQFIPNGKYSCELGIEHQIIGTINWDSRLGMQFEDAEKKKARTSPSIILMHEFGHANDAKTKGYKYLKDLLGNKTEEYKEEGYKPFWDQAEYSSHIKCEKPTAEDLGEGVRPKRFLGKYECSAIDAVSSSSRVDLKELNKK